MINSNRYGYFPRTFLRRQVRFFDKLCNSQCQSDPASPRTGLWPSGSRPSPVLSTRSVLSAKRINIDLTLGTSSTHLHVPDSQFVNIYRQDWIFALMSPTVKGTSKVKNVIHHFTPDVASAVALLSGFIKKERQASRW